MSAEPLSPTDTRLERWMRAMTDCIRVINAEQDLHQVLDVIARYACDLLNFRQCAVYVLDAEAGIFHIGGAHGLTELYVQTANAHPINLSEATATSGPPTARAVLTRLPVVVQDAFAEPGLERWRSSMRNEGLRMMVAAPLQSGDGPPIGTITGYSVVREVRDADIEQLTLLSDYAAAAIVAARRRDSEGQAISALADSNRALSQQRETISAMRDLQHDLTQLVVADSGLPAIIDLLARTLDAEVYLDTEEGGALSDTSETGPGSGAFATIATVSKARIAEIMGSGRAGRCDGDSEGTATFLVPVPTLSRPRVRMWVRANETRDNFDDHALRAMEECGLLISIERGRLEIRAHAEAKLVNDLIADLLSPASMVHPETVLARATTLGHDPFGEHTPIVVVSVDDDSSAAPGHDVAQLATSLGEVYRWMRPRPVFGTVGAAAVALVPARSGSDAVETILHQATRPEYRHLRWVVGNAADSLVGARPQLEVALRAAKLVTVDSAPIVRISHFGVPGLLLESGTTERMIAFAEHTLGPVIADDATKEGGLIDTLGEWFRCEMSAREAARRLFVHPNTVSYRLKRVGELTGLRLTNPSDLMTVRLALDILVVRGLAS